MHESKHAVILATSGQRDLLLMRALQSLAQQVTAPDSVILVDDRAYGDPNALVQVAKRCGIDADVLCNRRTKGASGAWNTALDHLTRKVEAPEAWFVSVLDDDDWWHRAYLAHVQRAARDGVAVVGGSIRRYDAEHPDGRDCCPPADLVTDDFLVGNPGLQGSNLTARLATLLEVGLFDEGLSSATDRDLALRLIQIDAAYKPVPAALAHHDATHGHSRLSDPGSSTKHRGLDGFHAKWRRHMTWSQEVASTQRARRLFGWNPKPATHADQEEPRPDPDWPASGGAGQPLALVVGAVVSGDNVARAKPLLNDLARLAGHERVTGLDVVLLENGNAQGFQELIAHGRRHGLTVWPVELAEQAAALDDVPLQSDDITRHKPIAVARTLLQRFAYKIVAYRNHPPAWILDDDHRLPTATDELIDRLVACRDSDADVVIGGNRGAPPVPAHAVVRTQLLDMVHFLQAVDRRKLDEPLDGQDPIVRSAGNITGEYHYDLSRSRTDHLETPYAICSSGQTIAEAVEEVLMRCRRLLAGEGISRPTAPVGEIPPEAAEGTCMRGGNTLIMATSLLRDVPNTAPRVDGRPTRRSDMLWAIDSRWRFDRTVRAVNLPLVHDRSFDPVDGESTQSLIDDLVGYSFARAYDEALKRGVTTAAGTIDAEWVLERNRHHARERLAAYRLSVWRCRGLIHSLVQLAATRPEWLRRASEPARREFFALIKGLRARTSHDHLADVEARVRTAIEHGRFREFLATREALTSTAPPPDRAIAHWRDHNRKAFIGALIQSRLGMTPACCLGTGTEGVVFRIGEEVVKAFDQWTNEEREASVPKLKALRDTPANSALPRVLTVHDWPEAAAVIYRFEPSTPYAGGHGDALVRLLRDLEASGWAHRNIRPSNLRVTREGLQIIDIGRSLVASDHHEKVVMIRRAFLSWRFADRDNLIALMRAAVHTDNIPELTGWRSLREAVQAIPSKARLDELLAERARALGADRLLDYGCGKPRDTDLRSVATGFVGFDPDATLRTRWTHEAPDVTFWDKAGKDDAAAHGEQFGTIVCSLVLCSVDDAKCNEILADLRRFSADDGRIIVSVCDPAAAQVSTTTDQCRHTPDDFDPDRHGHFTKTIRGSTVPRQEYHRPREGYRRAFARHGMQIVDETSITEIDTAHLERVPAFRIFELEPLPTLNASTSLLIKACALEAHTIAPQVRHLEHQLGRPRGFDEVILLIDPHEGPFPRAYWNGDLEGLRGAADQLVAEGRVDRVIEGPVDGSTAAAIAEHWTRRPAAKAHCEKGQPATGILGTFEACRGDYIFHTDADVLISRPAADRDIIADAVRCFDTYSEAVTLAPAVHGDLSLQPRNEGAGGQAYRTEAMAGWIAKKRLLATRPLPACLVGGRLAKPWHRMLDDRLAQTDFASLRCGNPALSFAGVDNLRKRNTDAHLLLLDRFEAGALPRQQGGHALVQGALSEWLGPRRFEELVVVICGRNPRVGAIDRCLRSLAQQTEQSWGAVIIDDASKSSSGDVLAEHAAGFGDRVTFVRRRRRAGRMANLRLAIRSLVADPESVIVLLDLDDALAAPQAMATVAEKHRAGADVTVGSMVRTDKPVHYPVIFDAPRRHRGGNVWQHLRSFRKKLFDRIESDDLSLDGDWIDIADDWAYMLPIVEMATHPVAIADELYLHEPSTTRPPSERQRREAAIGRITDREPYHRDYRPDLQVTVLAYHRVLAHQPTGGPEKLFHQWGMAVTVTTFRAQMAAALRRYTPIGASDLLAAARGERSLPANALLVTFDGGYRDVASNALPILANMGVEPLLFARASIGDGRPNWARHDYLAAARGLTDATTTHSLATQYTALERQLLAHEWTVPMGNGTYLSPSVANRARRDLYLDDAELEALSGIAIGMLASGAINQSNIASDSLDAAFARSKAWLDRRGGFPLAAVRHFPLTSPTIGRLDAHGFEATFGSGGNSNSSHPIWHFERINMTDDPELLTNNTTPTIREAPWNAADWSL